MAIRFTLHRVADRSQTQVNSVHEKEPVKTVNNEAQSVHSESPTLLEKLECTSIPGEEQPTVRKRERKSPAWPDPPLNNFFGRCC